MKKYKWLKIGLIILLVALSVMMCGGIIYINDYYHADEEAIGVINDMESKRSDITLEVLDGNAIALIPDNPKSALIFYPGGKVEYTAYVTLLEKFAKQGVLCILPEMPGNLAVLDVQAADRYRELYPEIDKWYLGGHSLGGSMAASCLSGNVERYDGLILLASYSTTDLSNTNLQVVSVYGTKDNVLNMEKYEEYKRNLPDNLCEMIIQGGCHAYFGNYGVQEGDGIPEISREEQMEMTVQYCLESMQLAK